MSYTTTIVTRNKLFEIVSVLTRLHGIQHYLVMIMKEISNNILDTIQGGQVDKHGSPIIFLPETIKFEG